MGALNSVRVPTLSESLRRAKARLLLRNAASVGRDPIVVGTPMLIASHGGRIDLGDDLFFSSKPSVSHLAALGGRITIGNGVRISYGAAISAREAVTIGDRVQIGPFVVLMDSDFHVAGSRETKDEPLPVQIEADVRIGARVTILRGSVIGAGAVLLDGSVVSGRVAAGDVVSGVPARSISAAQSGADGLEISVLVQRVLGLASRPNESDGPAQISEWDSLGALKLVLALEEAFGITLDEKEIKSMISVAEIGRVVAAAKERLGGA